MKIIGSTTLGDGVDYDVWTPTATSLTGNVDYRVIVKTKEGHQI